MKNKHLRKIVIVLFYTWLSHIYSTQTFQVQAYKLSGEPLGTKLLDLTLEEKKLIIDTGFNNQLIKKDNPVNRKLTKRLFTTFNNVGPVLYEFTAPPQEIIGQTFRVHAVAMQNQFRVDAVGSDIHIHILEPGIENNMYIIALFGRGNIKEGLYNDWQKILNVGTLAGFTINGRLLWNISSLNQMPDLLHSLNFSRFLAIKTRRTVEDIRQFLALLNDNYGDKFDKFGRFNLCPGLNINKIQIKQDSCPTYYSLNLMYQNRYQNTLMATLCFKGEDEEPEWLPEYEGEVFFGLPENHETNPGEFGWWVSEYETNRLSLVLSETCDRLILQSIMVGNHTYNFKHLLSLDLQRIKTIISCVSKHLLNIFEALNRPAGYKYITVFTSNGTHNRIDKVYNLIDLEKAMQEVEDSYTEILK